jgi:transglutaminase-like putative cysteine protease
MEEVGMIQVIFKRLFHFQEIIFLLTLMALVCLPIALSELVRDAVMSLLLPLTIFGAILAWALAIFGVRKSLSGFVLLILMPLALYVRISQMWDPLFELVRQFLFLIPAFINNLFYETQLDFSPFLSSKDELMQNILAFSGRLSLWIASILRGIQIEDPVIRTFVWSMVLWLVAAWAGWQIYRNKRFMAGMLPSTALLAIVLDYTGKGKPILWFHLALLLFLFGLTNYHKLQTRWNASHTDYAENTSVDTLLVVGAITIGLVAASYFVTTISIKDILEDFRERRAGPNESRAESLGLENGKEKTRVTGFGDGMPRSYLLDAGPEISTQLAMTISTGDLPPMPPNAQLLVPRYYWRAMTYSIYTGSGWANPAVSTDDIPADQALIESSDPNYRVVHAQITFPNAANERLYWPGTLVRADVPFKAAWNHKTEVDSLLDVDLLAALASVESYNVESVLLNVSVQELRKSPSVYPDWVRKKYLALPDSVPERVLALARDLTAAEPTAYDRALSIQNYLRTYPYTLDISTPPSNHDVADYFLFDLKQGYCDYYATSMVVLSRAAGLPARLVVGYANGAYDLEHAEYIVTENYAHSWVEIYFANIGWVEFEPTASQPAIVYEEQNESTTRMAGTFPKGQSSKEKFLSFLQPKLKNAWFPVIFMFVFGFLWIGFDSLRLIRIEPSRTIQLLYKRFRRLARPVTGTSSRNQTAHAYACTLIQRLSAFENSSRMQNWLMPSHKEINQLTELFSYSLFAPLPPTRAKARGAVKTWSRLRWRLVLANILVIKNKQVTFYT